MTDPDAPAVPQNCAQASFEPLIDTPLRQAIRRAFDYPSIANIEAVAEQAAADGRPSLAVPLDKE